VERVISMTTFQWIKKDDLDCVFGNGSEIILLNVTPEMTVDDMTWMLDEFPGHAVITDCTEDQKQFKIRLATHCLEKFSKICKEKKMEFVIEKNLSK